MKAKRCLGFVFVVVLVMLCVAVYWNDIYKYNKITSYPELGKKCFLLVVVLTSQLTKQSIKLIH